MTRKYCTKCNLLKPLIGFHKDKSREDGHLYHCKICEKTAYSRRNSTKDGLISKMYISQKRHSVIRGHLPPAYTKQELIDWMLVQDKFHQLFEEWIDSGCVSTLKPSCDRLDDYKGYSLDNLRVVTWEENKNRNYDDVKNGINNKKSKAVLQLTKEGIVIDEHYSIRQAERETGADDGHICKCCKGERKTAGGFVWCYA